MCISLHESEMASTQLYVGEAQHQGKTVHVLAYENSASSDGPNAMVLPFPTKVPMGPDNVIDTSKFKWFLKDISNATKMQSRGMTRKSRSVSFGLDDDLLGAAQVFDVGSYTVVLADNVEQIPSALRKVASHRRPTVTMGFLEGFAELYPEQPIALCCWSGAIEAEPLMWWYEPSDSSTFFIPTMDAHNGQAPKLSAMVKTDHIISVGGVAHAGVGVHYSGVIPREVAHLIPTHVYGTKLPGLVKNGDCRVMTGLDANSPLLVRGHKETVEFSSAMNGWH
jgi:hypothetical protein